MMKTRLDRLRPSMRMIFLHGFSIFVEGCAVVIALMVEPSQISDFLRFSMERWGLLGTHFLTLIGMLVILSRILRGQAGKMETWFADERHLAWSMILALTCFGFALPAALGNIQPIRDYPYFGRLRPSLFWLALASGQIGLNLLIVLRHLILHWFRQFFPDPSPAEEASRLPITEYCLTSAIIVLYVILQVVSHMQVHEALWLPDSIDYIFPAKTYHWNELGLWTHTKPWGATVLYKLIGSSQTTIDAVQTGLSTLAWISLAWVFSRSLNNKWLKMTAFAILLGFSLAYSIQQWNHIIQSESLSISLMALLLAVWISLLKRWRWVKFAALVLLLAWWTGTRETNLYLSLIVAIILVALGVFKRRQRIYWAVSTVLVLFGILNLQLSEVPTLPRWLYPLTNTLLNRILPDEEYLSYFQARGLDTPPELMALSGGFANSGDFAVYNNPALSGVEDWLFRKGKDTYTRFLIDHPLYTFTAPWQDVQESLASSEVARYAPGTFRQFEDWLFEGLLFPRSLGKLAVLAVAALAGMLWAKTWREAPLFWLVLAVMVLFIPHFYLVWHGDAAEVPRHAIQASIQLRLSSWLLLFLSLDKIVTHDQRIRTRHRP
jgi:hypothetical protein